MANGQDSLPIESKIPPEVIAAVDDYVAVRDNRMRLTEQETTAKQNLISVCKQFNLTVPFVLNNRRVTPIHKDDISVRSVNSKEKEGDD